jgi:hypothetical protein
MPETVLAMARRHVAEGRRRVTAQQARIAELDRDGHNTIWSRELLATLENSLRLMSEHLALEEQELAEQRVAASSHPVALLGPRPPSAPTRSPACRRWRSAHRSRQPIGAAQNEENVLPLQRLSHRGAPACRSNSSSAASIATTGPSTRQPCAVSIA